MAKVFKTLQRLKTFFSCFNFFWSFPFDWQRGGFCLPKVGCAIDEWSVDNFARLWTFVLSSFWKNTWLSRKERRREWNCLKNHIQPLTVWHIYIYLPTFFIGECSKYSICWVFGYVYILNTELLMSFSQYFEVMPIISHSNQFLKFCPAFRWPILPLPAVVPKLSSGKATSLCCHLMKGAKRPLKLTWNGDEKERIAKIKHDKSKKGWEN